jgi:hypothetical protein
MRPSTVEALSIILLSDVHVSLLHVVTLLSATGVLPTHSNFEKKTVSDCMSPFMLLG